LQSLPPPPLQSPPLSPLQPLSPPLQSPPLSPLQLLSHEPLSPLSHELLSPLESSHELLSPPPSQLMSEQSGEASHAESAQLTELPGEGGGVVADGVALPNTSPRH